MKKDILSYVRHSFLCCLASVAIHLNLRSKSWVVPSVHVSAKEGSSQQCLDLGKLNSTRTVFLNEREMSKRRFIFFYLYILHD